LIPDEEGDNRVSGIRYSADKYPKGSIAFISPGRGSRGICVWHGAGTNDFENYADSYMVYMLIFTGETYEYENKTWTRPSFYVKMGNRIGCIGSTYSSVNGNG
jgi:hypothetical protein